MNNLFKLQFRVAKIHANFSESMKYLKHQPTEMRNVISEIKNPYRKNMLIPMYDFKSFEKKEKLSFVPEMFSGLIKKHLVHSDVLRHLASKRLGLASSKDRSEVQGSTRKIHPQKGTGMARAGSSRAPHRRGGINIIFL